jgi:dipicolinate synthase subunit A
MGRILMSRSYTILGGDKRFLKLATLLKEDGNEVLLYGFSKLNEYKKIKITLEEAIKASEVIVGPLPFLVDNTLINAPYSVEEIQVEEVLNLLCEKQIFTAGKISNTIKDRAIERGFNIVDYFEREEMQVLNAIPSAEGAIQVAMENMPITLHSSNAMVLGYGRIGKALSKMLYGIGANTYVEARKYSDLAWIKSNGYIPVHLKDLKAHLGEMNVIFNTVPQLLLDEELLKIIKKDCLIIDLASKPGGVDFNAASKLNLKAMSALGLPGKVAPVTAARVIKETIYNIIEELEV